MAQLTPSSSRKRSCPDDEVSTSDVSTYNDSSAKRQCTSVPGKVRLRLLLPGKDIPLKPSSTMPPSSLRLLIPGKDIPPTPSSSVAAATTMALKLTIPQEQLTRDDLAKLNRHKSDAQRWKPKLQRPYPKNTEIKRAYPLKLLRHYPDYTTPPEPNFVRPKIDNSPRVTRLLQQFPLLETKKHPLTTTYPTPSPITPVSHAIPLSTLKEDLEHAEQANVELQWNKSITSTDQAQQLAWLAFSLPEQDRVDRGREAMIHSGLDVGDLQLEMQGWPNELPEWKKPRTGKFCKWGGGVGGDACAGS
jgi:hypothetical protein